MLRQIGFAVSSQGLAPLQAWLLWPLAVHQPRDAVAVKPLLQAKPDIAQLWPLPGRGATGAGGDLAIARADTGLSAGAQVWPTAGSAMQVPAVHTVSATQLPIVVSHRPPAGVLGTRILPQLAGIFGSWMTGVSQVL